MPLHPYVSHLVDKAKSSGGESSAGSVSLGGVVRALEDIRVEEEGEEAREEENREGQGSGSNSTRNGSVAGPSCRHENLALELLRESVPGASSGVLVNGVEGCGKTFLLDRLYAVLCELLPPLCERPDTPAFLAGFNRVVKCRGCDFLGDDCFRVVREVFRDGTLVICDDADHAICDRKHPKVAGVAEEILQCLNSGKVYVVAAVTDLDAVDAGVKRSGRIDQLLPLDWEERDRVSLFRGKCEDYGVRVNANAEDEDIRKGMRGWVASDVLGLVRRLARRFKSSPSPSSSDVGPSAFRPLTKSELLSEIHSTPGIRVSQEAPNIERIGWDDVGGMDTVKDKLKKLVVSQCDNAEMYKKYNLRMNRGVLLYGPPGCSKTMMGKALSKEVGGSFLLVKGPEILGKFLGESETAIRRVFHRARKDPDTTVLFFDEIDSIAGKRGSGGSDRVLSQLLSEIDGVDEGGGVVVVGATNRPDLIDDALIRKGRMDGMVYVPPPDKASRKVIFEIATDGCPLDANIDFDSIAASSDGFSGAECVGAVREAKIAAIDAERKCLTMEDLSFAISNTTKQITSDMIDFYEGFEGRKGAK